MDTSQIRVIDVATRWTADAAFFLVAAACILVAGVAADGTVKPAITFGVSTVVALVVERFTPVLPDPAAMFDESTEQPPFAVRQSVARYLLGSFVWIALSGAVLAALVLSWGGAELAAGALAASGITRLTAVRRLRHEERSWHARLSLSTRIWQRRPGFATRAPTSASRGDDPPSPDHRREPRCRPRTARLPRAGAIREQRRRVAPGGRRRSRRVCRLSSCVRPRDAGGGS